MESGASRPTFIAVRNAVICLLIVGAGMAAMRALVSMKKPPSQAVIAERPIRVQVQRAEFKDVPVFIIGYGEARPRDVYTIAPGISGNVIEIHPNLELGEIIKAGETLYAIDPRRYEERHTEAWTTVVQMENNITRLNKQFTIDKQRLTTFKRTRDLAKKEYERVYKLFTEQNIESQSFVDSKEMASNNAKDQYDLLAQSIELFPLTIKDAESRLAAAKASLERAISDIELTRIVTPADVRVKDVQLELYQYVSPSDKILTLADDRVLELSVSINSREARNWLRFDDRAPDATLAWFSELSKVPVEIAWTEALDEHQWHGTLDHVERFDQQTRTLTLNIRIEGRAALSPDAGHLPLVEGMFCRVRIPGQVAKDVVKVPAEAVGFDMDASGFRTVYIAKSDTETGETRLETRRVKESHIDGEFVYISQGIDPGDMVITTRLVNPLENLLLESVESSLIQAD